MSRVKRAITKRRRKKKIFRLSKGYWGKKSNCYRLASEAVDRAGNFAHRDRRSKKRTFKNLWILRINAACRENGLTYSKFINGLKKSKVVINRKVLSDIAVADTKAFASLVDLVKSH